MSQIDIISVSRKGQIVLPKKVREEAGISQGTKLFLIEKEGKITLSKADSLIEKESFEKEHFFPLLASEKSLAKGWLSKEDELAWKNL